CGTLPRPRAPLPSRAPVGLARGWPWPERRRGESRSNGRAVPDPVAPPDRGNGIATLRRSGADAPPGRPRGPDPRRGRVPLLPLAPHVGPTRDGLPCEGGRLGPSSLAVWSLR